MSKQLSDQISIIKKEHNDYETDKLLCLGGKKKESLLKYIDTSIKKPVRGTSYGILLPLESEDYHIKYQPPRSV